MNTAFDDEILRRLPDTEDHFTERKEAAHERKIRKAIVSFANSVIPEKPGIIYVGVTDRGVIKGLENPDKAQLDISSWAASCFPPIPVISRAIAIDGRTVVAVVVLASDAKPHFGMEGYKRLGCESLPLSVAEVDEWLSYRNSKVRFILEWKGKLVSFQKIKQGMHAVYGPDSGEYKLLDCNPHYVTLESVAYQQKVTEPLSRIEFKMDDAKDRLQLLFFGYY